MKKLLVALSMTAILAAPALARETLPWTNSEYPNPSGDTSGGGCTLLEYDGDAFVTYGTTPGWGDEISVTFAAPAGGPWTLVEAWYWMAGVSDLPISLYDGPADIFLPPSGIASSLGSFIPADAAPPVTGWNVVPVAGPSYSAGDLIRPGVTIVTSADVIGLADYLADGVPGHSWALFSGFWTDDTYAYGYDDGIRICLSGGPVPIHDTTWGKVKTLFE